MERVVETYDLMSEKYFTHASPTMFNAGKAHQAQSVFTVPTATFFDFKIMMVTWLSAGTPRPQLSSCFLVAMEGDSIEGKPLFPTNANVCLF